MKALLIFTQKDTLRYCLSIEADEDTPDFFALVNNSFKLLVYDTNQKCLKVVQTIGTTDSIYLVNDNLNDTDYRLITNNPSKVDLYILKHGKTRVTNFNTKMIVSGDHDPFESGKYLEVFKILQKVDLPIDNKLDYLLNYLFKIGDKLEEILNFLTDCYSFLQGNLHTCPKTTPLANVGLDMGEKASEKSEKTLIKYYTAFSTEKDEMSLTGLRDELFKIPGVLAQYR